ncbi:DNA polymerase III subunit chi [Litoreibacter roseus]|uniref:DNA polymerase III subunit chi n=1 Tax=Litoreibacter roseus TaxID=2601869 RepID=A0A6N6JDM1_9RHOB|nr:DNA polymerase III subunit chi [Litoreibacter roseus]GFE64057.1 DNA polymerase III subunit chi [Litoreibacter roseus]
MSEVFFYHLTRQPLDAILPTLLNKARGAGWRVAVRGVSADRMAWLDEKLWAVEGFLPHAQAGGPFDGEQPILLTTEASAANSPECIVSVDGADLAPEDIRAVTRAMILFDGNDPDAVAHARTQWKAVTEAKIAAKYWSQDSGDWQMKSEYKPD